MHVGIDPNPRTRTAYRREDWAESVKRMRATPSNHLHYAKTWAELEPLAGKYQLDEVSFMLEESNPLPVAFNLRVVDAGQRSMPVEYKALAWDSAEMIQHVTDMVERLASVLGRRPWSYAIGNEIDLYFDAHPSEIPAYARMLTALKARIRVLHPWARFTTAFQFRVVGRLRTLYAPIFAAVDHVTFTYYPLGANFVVRPPESVIHDLVVMVHEAQPKPLYLQEIGYPSAAILGSSPDQQALFVRLAFEAIRTWGPTYVLGATYLFQSELPEFVVALLVRTYGVDTENFRAYLRTLGLRDELDLPKPGWHEFVRQAGLITHRPQQ